MRADLPGAKLHQAWGMHTPTSSPAGQPWGGCRLQREASPQVLTCTLTCSVARCATASRTASADPCTSALTMTGSVRWPPASPPSSPSRRAASAACSRPSAARRWNSAFDVRARLIVWARSSESTTWCVGETRGHGRGGQKRVSGRGFHTQLPPGACRQRLASPPVGSTHSCPQVSGIEAN